MRRRTVLRGVAAGTAATSLSGCIGGLLNCGPGETKITDIESNPGDYDGETEVDLKGEVADVRSDNEFVLNDGTAKAAINAPGTLDRQALEDATCVEVTGYVLVEDTEEGDEVEIVAVSVVGETLEEE